MLHSIGASADGRVSLTQVKELPLLRA